MDDTRDCATCGGVYDQGMGATVHTNNCATLPTTNPETAGVEPVAAMLFCDKNGGRIYAAWPVSDYMAQQANDLYGDTGGYRTVPLYAYPQDAREDGEAMKPFIAMLASLREDLPDDFHIGIYEPGVWRLTMGHLRALVATTRPAPEQAPDHANCAVGEELVEHFSKVIFEADPAVGATWEEWVAYAEAHPHHLQAVEFVRRQARAALAAIRSGSE